MKYQQKCLMISCCAPIRLEAIAIRLEDIASRGPLLLGWRPSLVGGNCYYIGSFCYWVGGHLAVLVLSRAPFQDIDAGESAIAEAWPLAFS